MQIARVNFFNHITQPLYARINNNNNNSNINCSTHNIENDTFIRQFQTNPNISFGMNGQGLVGKTVKVDKLPEIFQFLSEKFYSKTKSIFKKFNIEDLIIANKDTKIEKGKNYLFWEDGYDSYDFKVTKYLDEKENSLVIYFSKKGEFRELNLDKDGITQKLDRNSLIKIMDSKENTNINFDLDSYSGLACKFAPENKVMYFDNMYKYNDGSVVYRRENNCISIGKDNSVQVHIKGEAGSPHLIYSCSKFIAGNDTNPNEVLKVCDGDWNYIQRMDNGSFKYCNKNGKHEVTITNKGVGKKHVDWKKLSKSYPEIKEMIEDYNEHNLYNSNQYLDEARFKTWQEYMAREYTNDLLNKYMGMDSISSLVEVYQNKLLPDYFIDKLVKEIANS